jgi:hypothetical protein
MSLLTLDKTTLFYYFLSDETSNSKKKYSNFSAGINAWAAAILKNSKSVSKVASGSKPNASKHSSSLLPPLTNPTTQSSVISALSKNVKISQDVFVKVEARDASIQIAEGGLDDDDETLEREAAIKSPPKGKKHVSSSVSK